MTKRWFLAGVFLTCLATLMLQVIETRLLSVTAHYHLAFFSISMAMFGMTAGAVWVYYNSARITADTLPATLLRFGTLFSLSTAASVLLQVTHAPVLVLSATTILTWTELALVMAAPFFFSGVVVSLALTRSPFPVSQVYAVDLIGASVGCLGVLLVLDVLDAVSGIFATAAVAAAAAGCFRAAAGTIADGRTHFERILVRPWSLCALMVVIAAANGTTMRGIQPVVVKNAVDRRDTVTFEQWNSYSRIMARKTYYDAPLLWGPSSTMPADLKVFQRRLNIDGDAATSMFRFEGDPATARYLAYDVTNLAYEIRNTGRAAVIGVGGGRDILSAWVFGFRDVTGVELNPIFIDLITRNEHFRDFANLASLPGIRFVVDEARSWFARSRESFDLVQMSMIDTFAAAGAGAFSLSENGLYTVEGWQHFLARLSPTGVFTVSRWYSEGEVNETGRMISLAVRTLLEIGVRDPSQHIFLAATGSLATLVLSRAPLTPAELATLQRISAERNFQVLLSPGKPAASPLLASIIAAKDAASLESATSGHLLDLTPPTDDRPFFFNQLPLTRAHKALNMQAFEKPGVLSGNIVASATLLLIVVLAAVLVLVTIVVPMRPAIRESEPRLVAAGTAYFVLIGLGFMFVEIGLLQRLSVFLGHPIYSLSIVLFSIILFTGLGSLASDRIALDRSGAFTAWAVLVAAYVLALPLLLPNMLQGFAGAGTLVRATLAVLMIAPGAFLMGFGFPNGMRLVMQHDQRPTPWFWGMNGAAGVLGSAIAVAISITFGIDTTLSLGALCYLALIPAAHILSTRSHVRDDLSARAA
jgi:SAM-dependent methyltransferase